ncbi:hypothetical protein SEET4502_09865 [Salmonella enterica subsp. enterica serovar Typhimurium str. 34502]|nr:hypothetical protein SEET4502_09865 [Salmonella enterica subsp. enterica serovar Typhimurium str. 34502]ERO18687.1 hypothetical protein SEET5423_08825 [Salmonella enterica subsp. enterica serovar Typhimurium str. 35423]OMI51377.1 hypothetical protein Q676_17590 [Escherichia coli N40607]
MKWYFVADAARKYIKMPHPAPIVEHLKEQQVQKAE